MTAGELCARVPTEFSNLAALTQSEKHILHQLRHLHISSLTPQPLTDITAGDISRNSVYLITHEAHA